MSKSLLWLFFACSLLSLCGCATKRYSHQQVMQSYHTKDDVLKRFGKPDRRRIVDSTEVWFYYHYSGPNNFRQGSTAAVNSQPDTTKAANSLDTLKAKQLIPVNTSISFIFDQQGNVQGYKSQGVDLAYSKKESFGMTALKVVGIAALVVLIVGLDAYGNADVDF